MSFRSEPNETGPLCDTKIGRGIASGREVTKKTYESQKKSRGGCTGRLHIAHI